MKILDPKNIKQALKKRKDRIILTLVMFAFSIIYFSWIGSGNQISPEWLGMLLGFIFLIVTFPVTVISVIWLFMTLDNQEDIPTRIITAAVAIILLFCYQYPLSIVLLSVFKRIKRFVKGTPIKPLEGKPKVWAKRMPAYMKHINRGYAINNEAMRAYRTTKGVTLLIIGLIISLLCLIFIMAYLILTIDQATMNVLMKILLLVLIYIFGLSTYVLLTISLSCHIFTLLSKPPESYDYYIFYIEELALDYLLERTKKGDVDKRAHEGFIGRLNNILNLQLAFPKQLIYLLLGKKQGLKNRKIEVDRSQFDITYA